MAYKIDFPKNTFLGYFFGEFYYTSLIAYIKTLFLVLGILVKYEKKTELIPLLKILGQILIESKKEKMAPFKN